jgi:hypothetical protein
LEQQEDVSKGQEQDEKQQDLWAKEDQTLENKKEVKKIGNKTN